MIINEEEINITRGLPQSLALSLILFNIYITQILNEIIGDNNYAGQAYVDDTVLQAKDISILQTNMKKSKRI